MSVQDAQSAYRRGVEKTIMQGSHDPLLERFLLRIPQNVVSSFTDAQLAALKQALDERGSQNHKVNIRISVPLLFRHYYFVFFTGIEKRSRARRRRDARFHPIARVGNMVFLFLLSVFALFAVVGFLAILISVLDIDVLPETPGGFWSALGDQFRLMFR